MSAAAPGLGVLILGNSILEGVGTALLIPPVYILTTLLFTEVSSRARAFGAISAMGGIGAAAGPLIGGLITSAISWRAAFVFQALVIAVIVLLSRRIHDPLPADPTRPFDTGGAVLSAVGLVLVVMGILAADDNVWLMLALLVAGALVLAWFFWSVRAKERAGQEPLLSTALFRNRTSNLGLVTQNTQWLLLMGVSFVVAAYLQVVRGYDAIQTGVIFTAATVGLLVSSLAAERLAKRRPQRTLILAGFLVTIAGIGVLLALVSGSPSVWAFAPGLLLIGLGLGADADPLGQRRAVQLPRASCRARSPACRAACPTSAPPWAPRSPAPSWSPASPPPPNAPTGWRWPPWPRSAWSGWWPRPCCPPTSRHRPRRQRRRRRPDTRDNPGPWPAASIHSSWPWPPARCQATEIGRTTLAMTTPRLDSSRSGSVERIVQADPATSGSRVRRFWTTAILPPPRLPSARCTEPPS